MLGAIAGDIIGSVYEFHPIKPMGFPLFGKRSEWTDGSVLTMAMAEMLLTVICTKRRCAVCAGVSRCWLRWDVQAVVHRARVETIQQLR